MLSKEGLKIINLMLRLGTHMESHPFRYDEKAQIVWVKHSLWKWRIMAVVMNMYTVFILGRIIESLVVLNLPLSSCVLQVYYLLVNFYFAGLQLNYLVNKDAVANFITQYMLFSKLFTANNPNAVATDKSGKILQALVVTGYSHALFHGVTFYFLRNNPNFLYSLVVQIWPSLNLFSVQLVFALFEVTIVFQCWTTAILTTTTWFTFMENVKIWNEFASDKFKDAWSEGWVLYFRGVDLLMGRFNEAYSGPAMCVAQLSVLLECTICLYATLEFYGRIHILVYACMPISDLIMLFFMYLLFTLSGNVVASGEDLLKVGTNTFNFSETPFQGIGDADVSLRKEVLHKLLKVKMIRSCRCFVVQVGHFFVIRHGTFFTYAQIIVNNTITLLLANRKPKSASESLWKKLSFIIHYGVTMGVTWRVLLR